MNLGRHVLGAAALASGLVLLAWHGNPRIDYAVAAVQIFGGAAIQFRRSAKLGAAFLTAAYSILALESAPQIVATPMVFWPWGNFFESFSVAVGAAIVYAQLSSAIAPETLKRIGRILFGICAVTFALYQALYPQGTIPLVPRWLPPSQVFWADATTVAFALAAVALLVNRMALLATQLVTLMIVMFGLLVWVPAVISKPHNQSNWTEIVTNYAIAGAAWVLADLLSESS